MDDFPRKRVSEVTITIDTDLCIGSGNCVKIAPEVFEMDENHQAAFRPDGTDIERERVIEACSVCPVDALRVEE